MAHLIDIFLQPTKVFEDLKQRPTFLVPLLVLAGASIAMSVGYFLQVDPAWLADQQVAEAGRELSAKEMAQMRKMMPGPTVMAGIASVGTLVATAVFAALLGLYYLLAGKVTGHPVSFRHGVSLMAWSGMPAVLGVLVALVGVATMSPQTPLPSLMLTNIDPLFVQLPADHRFNKLAEAFSLLQVWSIALGALGWRTWTRSGWGQAIVVSALPAVLIFGGMFAWALVR